MSTEPPMNPGAHTTKEDYSILTSVNKMCNDNILYCEMSLKYSLHFVFSFRDNEKIEEVRPIRNQLCELLGVSCPQLLTKVTTVF